MDKVQDGRSPASQGRATQAPPEAPTGLRHPVSVPNADDLIALSGARYSPNLRKWLRAQTKRRLIACFGTPRVFRDRDNFLWIGWIDDDKWFIGCRLARCLTVGTGAEVGCWTFPISDLTEQADFWTQYAAIGRCVIDPLHNGWWSSEDTRWEVSGDMRSCLWCGKHTQRLRRWTERVKRQRWEPASAMSASGQDPQGLEAKPASAARSEAEGDAQ